MRSWISENDHAIVAKMSHYLVMSALTILVWWCGGGMIPIDESEGTSSMTPLWEDGSIWITAGITLLLMGTVYVLARKFPRLAEWFSVILVIFSLGILMLLWIWEVELRIWEAGGSENVVIGIDYASFPLALGYAGIVGYLYRKQLQVRTSDHQELILRYLVIPLFWGMFLVILTSPLVLIFCGIYTTFTAWKNLKSHWWGDQISSSDLMIWSITLASIIILTYSALAALLLIFGVIIGKILWNRMQMINRNIYLVIVLEIFAFGALGGSYLIEHLVGPIEFMYVALFLVALPGALVGDFIHVRKRVHHRQNQFIHDHQEIFQRISDQVYTNTLNLNEFSDVINISEVETEIIRNFLEMAINDGILRNLRDFPLVPEEQAAVNRIQQKLPHFRPSRGPAMSQNQHPLGYFPHNGHIREIFILEQNLRIIPEDIVHFAALEHLDLTLNYITEIPPFLYQLTQLRQIILKNNEISIIPAGINRLSNMTQLNLANNKVIEINPEIFQIPTLTEIFLDHNVINTIPYPFPPFPSLQKFRIYGNPLNALQEIWAYGEDAEIMQALHDYQAWSPDRIIAKIEQETWLSEIDLKHPEFARFEVYFQDRVNSLPYNRVRSQLEAELQARMTVHPSNKNFDVLL